MEKDKFDAYLVLAKFRRDRFEARNQLEWRISFSLWALLAAAIYYMKNAPLPLWIAALIWCGHAFMLYKVLMRNQEDNWLAAYYALEGEKLITDSPRARVFGLQMLQGRKALYAFWTSYSALSQLLTTAILLATPHFLAVKGP